MGLLEKLNLPPRSGAGQPAKTTSAGGVAPGVDLLKMRPSSPDKKAPNLFPKLQDISSVPQPQPTRPTKPAPPPKEALARAGDSRQFWRPAPTGADTPPVVDRSWLRDFLRFYRVGPPKPADPGGTTCSFNGATMTVAAALDIVDAQSTLNGYKPSRSTASGLLQDLIAEGVEAAALGDRIATEPSPDIGKLEAMPMPKLLQVLDRLKALKKLEPFVDRLTNASARIGAAIATVRGDFEDIQWQSALPKLSEADLAAVMMRAPAKIRRITPGPVKAGEKPEEPIEVEAVVGAARDGIEMQVKLIAHSPLGASLGETEGSVHIGPDGKVTEFELDVKAFQATLFGGGGVAEITATVSANATIEMEGGTRIAPEGINAQLKAELSARLRTVKVLSGVSVKLTGTYGTAGGAVSAGLEFKIPGT